MSSRSSILAILVISILFLNSLSAAASDIPVDDEGTEVTEVKQGASTGDRILAVSEKTIAEGLDIGTSGKPVGTPYKGALILCEGPTPISKFFTTRTSSVFLFPIWSSTCTRKNVIGNGQLNHAKLWNGGFTGMDYFLERLITCPVSGKVCLQAQQGSVKKILYCCQAGWEAHVITFGI